MGLFIGVSKMNRKLAFVILMLLFAPGVFALGVSPGRTTLDFSPNLEKEISFSVTNTENKDMGIAFTVEGDLADFVTLSSKVERFSADEGSKEFSYIVNLPRGLSPGLHEADIITTEVPAEGVSADTTIRASVSVVTQLRVYVPYPGKYVDVNFDVVNEEESGLIKFYLPLISRGDEEITSVKGVIGIYKESELVDSLETNELSLSAGEKKEILAVWNPDIAPGKYRAVAKIDYDGEKKEIEKEFNVGKENLEVLGVSVNDFKLGDVARIKIIVQNKLSDTIEKATANMEIKDSGAKEIAKLKSEDYEIPPLRNSEMVLYWDTENLEAGEYGSELKIDFDDKFVNKQFKVDVSEDSMKFVGVGFVVDSGSGEKISTSTFLLIVIGFLVLVNFAGVLWWIRHRKKK
jgi:hypothetical protein